MHRRIRFPIRFKIMLLLLLVVTGVVSTITFTMARLFHDDKQAYINDLVSTVALSVADEARSILGGYRERIRVYARIVDDQALSAAEKIPLIEGLFEDFPELVALFVDDGGAVVPVAHNSALLETAGVDIARLSAAVENRTRGELSGAGRAAVRNLALDEKLPVLALTTTRATDDGSGAALVTAVILLDELQRMTARYRGFEVFLADDGGTLLAHAVAARAARGEPAPLHQDARRVHETTSAGLTVQFDEAGTEMIGSFASVDLAGAIAGVRIPRSAAFLATRDLLRQLMLMALALLIVATVVGLFWARSITGNVERLSEAARVIARGEFAVRVDAASRDEIGDLAETFNAMAGDLHQREQELQQAHDQLIQSEKMAAFGQLGAGIAHEVKNPLAGILGCAQLSLRRAEKGSSIHENLMLIEKETKRCKQIIENLMRFARQEAAVLEPVAVNQVVEDSVAIVRHQLELSQVKLDEQFAVELPLVQANANQLQQVLMNLMINAQQAMEGRPGEIRISTCEVADGVELWVRDDGPGIPLEHQAKLFEPFFTTKPGGKGTGLGLSVSFGIIKDHGGTITVDSAPGRGATFVIRLPRLEAQAIDSAVEESPAEREPQPV